MLHDPVTGLLAWLLAAQLVACAGLMGVIWAFNRWHPADCGHDDLMAVAVSKADSCATALGAVPKATEILWRCTNCDHVESTSLPGSWSLPEVLAWGHGAKPGPWPVTDDTLIPAGHG
jgi:hypothetical protein